LNSIKAELETIPNHEWAGVYFYGDGTGCNVTLTIAPQNGAVYTWHGCLGLYESNHGSITEVSNECIQIKWTNDPAISQWKAVSSRLVRVVWAGRHYLIPDTRMISFCNAVNRGSEPGLRFAGKYRRPHNFLLRQAE